MKSFKGPGDYTQIYILESFWRIHQKEKRLEREPVRRTSKEKNAIIQGERERGRLNASLGGKIIRIWLLLR